MKLTRILICLAVWLTGMTSAAAQSAPKEGAALSNGMEKLMVSRSAGNIMIKIDLREPLKTLPSNFSIANPARLVFDLPGIENALGYSSKQVNEGGLRSLNVVQAGERARLVLNLERILRFDSRLEGKSLFISLQEGGAGEDAKLAAGVQQFVGVPREEKPAIRDIQFRRGKDGAGMVMVDLSVPDAGIDIQQKGSLLHVSFKKTLLPDNLRRQLEVGDFATPVTTIKTRTVGDDVSMEIAPKGLWEHTAFQADNQFIVEVRPLKEDPNKLFQGSKSGYQGEAISLNFQNIPLRELLHVFADITNFNIVVSDSVQGNVSLRLNDVAWDHALEIVLQQKNLAMRKSGNVLWIAPREELAARDKLEVEARDAAVAAELPRMEIFQMKYQKAEDFALLLSGDTKEAASDKKPAGFLSTVGKVTVDKRTNQVFVYDVPSKLDLVRGLLAQVDRAPRQVLIEARIVEADDGYSKALGVRLGGADAQGLTKGNPILGNDLRWGIAGSQEYANYHVVESAPLPLMTHIDGGQLKYDTAKTAGTSVIGGGNRTGNVSGNSTFVNLPVADAVGQFALALFNANKTKLLTLEFSAAEADSKTKTISSPRILTADQVEATIQAGERIPYLTATASGATSVAWQDATLQLKVKPQITPDGRIMMKIKINKDALGRVVPGVGSYSITTKEVNSEVHVENGGTVVIGGIFEQEEKTSDQRVPFLGDLPYVGFLFKSKSQSTARKELIIMLTPRIVEDSLSVRL